MTGAARRAALTHPTVRFWLLVAGVLFLAMAYLMVTQVTEWSREVRLVEGGAAVDATVFEAGVKMKNRVVPPLANVDLSYAFGGQDYKVTGALAERPAGTVMSGQTIPIRVDPENPKVWTSRTTRPELGGKLVAPLMLLPVVLVAGGVAWLARRRVAGLWVDGEAREAVVVDTRQAALAPRSQAVRCALVGGEDRRLITVYVPLRGGKLGKGDRLWLVTQLGNPQRAVAARAFEGEG
jgi:hypothetical protein